MVEQEKEVFLKINIIFREKEILTMVKLIGECQVVVYLI